MFFFLLLHNIFCKDTQCQTAILALIIVIHKDKLVNILLALVQLLSVAGARLLFRKQHCIFWLNSGETPDGLDGGANCLTQHSISRK